MKVLENHNKYYVVKDNSAFLDDDDFSLCCTREFLEVWNKLNGTSETKLKLNMAINDPFGQITSGLNEDNSYTDEFNQIICKECYIEDLLASDNEINK